jgi:MFS family permease
MTPSVFTRLSLMMLLQYFIWGAWYVTLGAYMTEYLQASGVQIGAAYGALAIATMISPFFVGLVADRFFAAQQIMGTLHVCGAALLFLATQVESYALFYGIIVVYSLLYMPTIALSNSVAFSQMTDPGKQFPWIRVFGTLGWIVAGILISWLKNHPPPFSWPRALRPCWGFLVLSYRTLRPKGKPVLALLVQKPW